MSFTYRVEVKVADDVAQVLHHGLACGIAGRVRRTHVCRVLSNDVPNGHFILDHLVVTLRVSDDAKILMRPSVRCDLVALCDHELDDGGPLRSRFNGTFSKVDASNEKGSFESVRGKLIQNTVRVDVGPACGLVTRTISKHASLAPA